MFTLDFDTVGKGVQMCVEAGEKLAPEPIEFFPYINRVLKEEFEKTPPKFPMEVKLPGSTARLLKGDAAPSKIITLNEPLTTQDGQPMWFESTVKQAYLRCGYTNRDARYICNQKLDSDNIHFFLGGSTGHGKSVLLNSLIGALCYEYAPWELELNLSDAKIVEFKRYGMGAQMPQIRSIAATSDADYVISVLDRACEEMMMRSKIFSAFGVQNLSDFRKKTGLAMPRVIVVCDEFESTCRMAGRRASVISQRIDDFARLGRSAGYHMILATQNLTADIPQTALGQIKIRGSLGAASNVSQAILENDGACENMGRKGILILNTNVLNGGKTKPHNITYQVPYQSDKDFEDTIAYISKQGVIAGYDAKMDFYDEEDVKTIAEFQRTIDDSLAQRSGEDLKCVCLPIGNPAFVTPEVDGLLKLRLDHRDIENICVCSSLQDRTNAHLANIAYGLKKQGYSVRLLSPTPEDLEGYVSDPLLTTEVRTAIGGPLSMLPDIVKKRLFLMAIDERLQAVQTYDVAAVEEAFKEDGVPTDKWSNTLFCRRAAIYLSFRSNGALAAEWKAGFSSIPTLKHLQSEYEHCHASIREVRKEDFEKIAFFIGDLSKIVGYGREAKSTCITQLKLAMQDACRVNFVFVLFTKSMDELTGLVPGIRFTIFDMPDSRDWGRMRTEAPVEVKDNLAVLNDALSNSDLQKFKRTLLKEEI